MVLEVDSRPVPGATFNYLVGGAPPLAFGLMGLGFGPPPTPGVPFGGALVCLGPPPIFMVMISGPRGDASLPVPVPSPWPVPIGVHAQAFWFTPAACAQPFTSSATLFL